MFAYIPPAYGDINSQLDSNSTEDSRRIYQQRGAKMTKQKSVVRGIVAGMAGGLAAAWVMNVFMASAGPKPEQAESSEPKEDATIVHYTFGALTGGLYGGLAEYSDTVTSGFGTGYGGALFSTADFLAVPALNLGPSATDQPASALATPFAAHIIYGATTEFVRRIVRMML